MNAQNLPKFSINQEFSQFSEPSFSSNPSLFSEKKSSSQFKALFLKSVTLQFKQIGTNICQVSYISPKFSNFIRF